MPDKYVVTGSSLTSVANAIRAKSGSNEQLTFPAGFVSEIENISGGGEVTLADLASRVIPVGEVDITGLTFVEHAFSYSPNITSVVGSGTFNRGYLFQGCSGVSKVHISLTNSISSNFFTGCTGLTVAVMQQTQQGGTAFFNGCTALEVADLDVYQLRNNYFYNNTNLATIILRRTSDLTRLESVAVFATANHFKSGGTGGTIYIPKVFYDELGTGSENDYKAATNWSTVDGYGTITWAQIEGSQYENYYADSTPIPTT